MATPSAALSAAVPVITNDVGPVIRQLAGCTAWELTGRFLHATGVGVEEVPMGAPTAPADTKVDTPMMKALSAAALRRAPEPGPKTPLRVSQTSPAPPLRTRGRAAGNVSA